MGMEKSLSEIILKLEKNNNNFKANYRIVFLILTFFLRLLGFKILLNYLI